jgi:hypothetical protein
MALEQFNNPLFVFAVQTCFDQFSSSSSVLYKLVLNSSKLKCCEQLYEPSFLLYQLRLSQDLRSPTSQKTAYFIVTTVKTLKSYIVS